MIYLRNNRGVAAVELAFCLPILIVLVFGSIEFGLLFYNQQVITNASREGARAGITGIGVDAIKNIVLTYCNHNEGPEDNELINLNGSDELQSDLITIPDADEDNVPDLDAENNLTVSVSYKYNFLIGSMLGVLGFTDLTLSAQTVMRME
ncbi:MAG: pilus assembly protein [Deltaproteobacteria bacterium]|jgi:hypothetical protein|nr:pilus assembly protein [Deltaproteobacteria bacterium]